MEAVFYEGVVSIANLLISIFVLIFAIFFLHRMRHHRGKKPWVLLFFAIIVFLVLQIFNVLGIVGLFDLTQYRLYFDLIFLAIMLLTFIMQYNLVLHSERVIEEHRRVLALKAQQENKPKKK